MEAEGAEKTVEDITEQGNRLRPRFISKLLLFSVAILAPLHNAGAWECDVTLTGPNVIKVDQEITLIATGTPEGGSYSWSNTTNLVSEGATAHLTGFEPEYSDYIPVTVTYTTPKGKTCSDRKWIWVCICYVNITGPAEAQVGETVTLTAEGDPSGGAFEWSDTEGLSANGSQASFTPQSAGEVPVEVTYTNPDGEICSDTLTVTVEETCSVTIDGPSEVGQGNTIDLTATGDPPDGTFEWTPLSGLTPGTSSATLSGESPGTVTVEVSYTPPEAEDSCSATHDVTVFGVTSIIGPSCVASGTTLSKSDFTVVTEPSGFENQVTIDPLSFSTLSQSEEVTVTAYSGTGADSDEAATTIMVVNSDVNTGQAISFEIPNYISKPLETIGLADKIDISVKDDFKSFKECCLSGVGQSTDGSFKVALAVSAGPFTIVGVPIPPKYKKWVAADIVNATLSGEGSVNLQGSYMACEDKTKWNGGGDLSAGVEVAAMVTAKDPEEVIVIKGKLSGSTSIIENLSTEKESTELNLTTDWGGLTASGCVKFLIRKRKIMSFEGNGTWFKKEDLLSDTTTLPDLRQE